MRAYVLIAIITVATFATLLSTVASAYTVTKFLYTLNTDGTADVKVFVSNITSDETEVVVKADQGIIESSVRAYDSTGDLYPTEVTDHSVVVYTTGSIDYLTIEYTAIVGTATATIVNVTISPSAPATVELPEGAALIDFNGSPEINVVNNKLVLEYIQAGNYYIAFSNPAPPVTTTTTTTTSTTTTTTTPITTTTTTTTPAQTTTATTTTSTTTMTTTTTTSPGTTTTTTTTTSTTTTTTAPAGGGLSPAVIGGVAVVIAIVVAAALYFFRRGGLGAGHSAGTGPSGGSAAAIVENLDDRDKAILSAVAHAGKSISDLARELGLSKSVVWRRVNKLVEFGLLRRSQDRSGRVIIELTDKGREALK